MWLRRKQDTAERFLVVCLGNPGKQYETTRHNVGFLTADVLANRWGISVRKLKFKALYAEAQLSGKRIVLLKPQTYMNLSGEAVRQAADFYKIPPERIIVIADDTALPPGRLRIRRRGSAGGHNGLKNIIAQLGTDEFPRIKIGVGLPPHPDYEMMEWVLGTPVGKEKAEVERAIGLAADAVEVLLQSGIDQAMNHFNGL